MTVDGVGWEGQGAGAAIAYLDADPRPELILMAYDNPDTPDRENNFRYRIGWNLDAAGIATRWDPAFTMVEGLGWEGQGAGIAIHNLDDDLRPEIFLMAYDNPAGDNEFRYRVLSNRLPTGLAQLGFRVRRFRTSVLSDADADRILNDASTVLQQNDGEGDVACPLVLSRLGPVTAFADGDGSIDTEEEFNAIMYLTGEIMVVNAINWCGGIIPALGCAPVPGDSLVVVRYTPELEGILWAHEIGHTRGLCHCDDASATCPRPSGATVPGLCPPNHEYAVMNGLLDDTHRRVSDLECAAYRPAPAFALAAAVGTPTAAVDGAGSRAEPQAAQDVRSFARQTFIHGVPYDVASRFGREAVPVLLEMLRNPQEQQFWSNIVVVLGMI